MLHVHFAGGGFLVGGGTLTPEEFTAQVLDYLNLAQDEVLILVACQTAARPEPGAEDSWSAASTLALVSERPVIAATADAFTTPDGKGRHHPRRRRRQRLPGPAQRPAG